MAEDKHYTVKLDTQARTDVGDHLHRRHELFGLESERGYLLGRTFKLHDRERRLQCHLLNAEKHFIGLVLVLYDCAQRHTLQLELCANLGDFLCESHNRPDAERGGDSRLQITHDIGRFLNLVVELAHLLLDVVYLRLGMTELRVHLSPYRLR